MNRKGFTLIELLVVVAIIGIISAIGIVTFKGMVSSSEQKSAENSLRAIGVSQQDYRSSYGKYYGTSGSSGNCSGNQTTTNAIITNLFDGTDNLTEQKFYFCTTADSSTFTIVAKHKTKSCMITMNNKNYVQRTSCDD